MPIFVKSGTGNFIQAPKVLNRRVSVSKLDDIAVDDRMIDEMESIWKDGVVTN
jgi:hypothetical protein